MRSQATSVPRLRRYGIAAAIVIACLIVVGRNTGLLVDWLWFSSIGYAGVFWTILSARVLLFVAVFAVSAVAIGASGWLAHRYARPVDVWQVADTSSTRAEDVLRALAGEVASRIPWRAVIAAGAVILGLAIAAGAMSSWDVALRFLHRVPFGAHDPIFGKDIGFYLFALPVWIVLKNLLLQVVVCCAIVAGGVYWLRGDIMLRPPKGFSSAAAVHGSALLALFFLVKAWSWWLERFLLLYDNNGVVVGAGYTDVHVMLPVLWLLVGLAIGAVVAMVVNMRQPGYQLPAAAMLLVFGTSFALGIVYPALFQRFYVKPSELQLETPYIRHNIALTRQAYGLAQIEVKPFAAEQGLNLASLQANRATVDNIRLWDVQPLMDTYAQLQEIRTYYKFFSVDIDRYRLDSGYRQVMLSARELEHTMLPENARTWVNLHLLFTHGNGIVMSPVTEKSTEGLPSLYLHDIPPVADGGPAINEPRIYFGEGGQGYVIVKGSVPEFDYPKGDSNVYTSYSGRDGVAIGGAVRRSLPPCRASAAFLELPLEVRKPMISRSFVGNDVLATSSRVLHNFLTKHGWQHGFCG